MFKHLSMVFDCSELPSLINRYEKLQTKGQTSEAQAVRNNIVEILKKPTKNMINQKLTLFIKTQRKMHVILARVSCNVQKEGAGKPTRNLPRQKRS